MVSVAKLSSIGILFIISFVFGLIVPYLLLKIISKKFSHSLHALNTAIGFVNCLSGGVFFASSILTLLPEARATMEKAEVKLNDIEEYPNTELIIGIGFLLILLVENVTVFCYTQKKRNKYKFTSKQILPEENKISGTVITSFTNSLPQGQTCGGKQTADCDSKARKEKDSNETEIEKEIAEETTTIRNIVLLLALSIHMVFDGLEVGLLEKESKVWSVLLALSIHKILILFSMGLKFCESVSTKKFIMAMVFMSAISPIGIGAGIALSSTNTGAIEKASAILQAFAVGTFIYVTFFEILLKEFLSTESNRIIKAVSTISGFAIFAIIGRVIPE